ncbi:aminoglycoside phosphotransferase (APT) family kinase protein [Chryseomicrobium aureum]|uniref:phosphotransferase family protein n=1 Tax=Chryseomicrobium aureum TaxID=1441723 RepID=UPI00195859C6|nr:phosphotransferase family protein [Chryseomicrobium aureum]MBM7707167.1 aminoglycoside phosphotransferase (APT) family kinase protein [Chryseomicrobium aureum]
MKSSEFIHWDALESILKNELNLSEGHLIHKKFSEGYSNMTFLLTLDKWEGVMRRPPGGELPPRAHDMHREFQLLEKLSKVYPLAPTPLLYLDDKEIMDKHFYIMEKKNGVVIDENYPTEWGSSTEVGPILSRAIVDALIDLQKVDYKQAGLANFGKPEGFMERQVSGWIRRYSHAKTKEISSVTEIEGWLTQNVPKHSDITIVHNDFKLNNLVFDDGNPSHVTGVLDWELATIGDPLSDVGSSLAYWGSKDDPNIGIHVLSSQQGFYSRREMAEYYAKGTGKDLSNINFYLAFGFYKLGVILQQIYARWENGSLEDQRFSTLDEAVENLMNLAIEAKEGRLV